MSESLQSLVTEPGLDQLVAPPRNPAMPADWAQNAVLGTATSLANLVMFPRRAMDHGVTTEQAIPFGAETALMMAGAGGARATRGAIGSSGGKLIQPETKAPSEPKLTPVDHDPFSKPVDQSFMDTRGKGINYHGAPNEVELSEGHYGSSRSYYGTQGLYTTDALDVGRGYANRRGAKSPSIYEVKPRVQNPKVYDMEAAISPSLEAEFKRMVADPYGDAGGIVESALSEKPKNLREFFDHVRDYAAGERVPADEIQESVFHPIMDKLESEGFHGMSHVGGLRTKTPAHTVTIYFSPEKNVGVEKMTAEKLGVKKKSLEAVGLDTFKRMLGESKLTPVEHDPFK